MVGSVRLQRHLLQREHDANRSLAATGRNAAWTLLTTSSLLVLLTSPSLAQSIPPNTNLNTTAAPSGGVWDLQGNAFLSNTTTALVTKVLPSAFTINGAPGGSTITLNDGALHFGRFSLPASSVLNLSNVTLTGGLAAASGAMLFGAGSTLNVAGAVSFSDNQASVTDAGAISAAGAFTINGTAADLSFRRNVAARFGAGITDGTLTIGGTFNNIVIDGNTGGAIFASTGIVIDTQTSGTLAITNNAGLSTGGGLRAGADGIAVRGSYGSVLIDGNSATGPFGGGLAVSTGGSIAFNATIGSLIVSNNTAVGRGGGFGSGKDITLDGTYGSIALIGNSSQSGGAFTTPGVVAFGTLASTQIGSLRIEGNQATAGVGGAIATGAGIIIAPATIGDIVIASNQATGNGGALSANGLISIANGNPAGAASNLIIRNNVSGGIGGAVWGNSPGGISIGGNYNNVAIESNTAAGNGGAFHALGTIALGATDTHINKLTVTGNSSTTSRGGAFSAGGSINLNGSYGTIGIAGNTAQVHGGAFFSLGSVSLTPTAGVMTVTGNTAATGSGGAVFAFTDFTLSSGGRTDFSGNIAAAQGGAIWAGGNVLVAASNGDITFSGNAQGTGANALYLDNAGGGKTANLNAAAGRAITFFDPIESNSANGLIAVSKTGSGLVSFDGARYAGALDRWSKIYGTTSLEGGTFEIANNAVYGVLASDVGATDRSSFIAAAGTILQGGGVATLRADNVTLAGELSIAGRLQEPRSVFNIVSSNVAFNGGSVRFNTFLNDGVVQNTDRLVLDLAGSATSGQANILVSNIGGPGALTLGNGIELVQTNNGTSAGAFRLGGPVVAGPYEYTLHQGGIDGSSAQNWFLRSTLDCSLPGAPSPPCPAPTPPGPPVPNYRAETSLYAALPAMVLGYGRNLIDTLHERVGEEQPGVAPGGGQGLQPTLGWARFVGLKGTREGSPNGIFGDGPKYGYGIVAFQGGLDLYRAERSDGGRDHVGVYAAVGQITADVMHFNALKVGTNTIDAYSLGAYWTRFAASGWYLDAVAQFTWNDARAVSHRLPTFSPDGSSVAVSMETGLPIALGGGWQIEPQAQLIYQRAWLGSTSDGAATIRFMDAESLAGRLGARILRSWSLDDQAAASTGKSRMMTAWLRPNIWYEFFGNPKTEFSSATGFIPFRADVGGAWVELNAGIDAQVRRNVSLIANAGYQWGLDGRSEAYNGKLGVRVTW